MSSGWGMLELVVVVAGWVLWRSAKSVQGSPPRPAADSSGSSRLRDGRPAIDLDTDALAGWLLGHEIAAGREGFPGDPLPGGHLGSAANLAFWSGVLGADLDDERDP